MSTTAEANDGRVGGAAGGRLRHRRVFIVVSASRVPCPRGSWSRFISTPLAHCCTHRLATQVRSINASGTLPPAGGADAAAPAEGAPSPAAAASDAAAAAAAAAPAAAPAAGAGAAASPPPPAVDAGVGAVASPVSSDRGRSDGRKPGSSRVAERPSRRLLQSAMLGATGKGRNADPAPVKPAAPRLQLSRAEMAAVRNGACIRVRVRVLLAPHLCACCCARFCVASQTAADCCQQIQKALQ